MYAAVRVIDQGPGIGSHRRDTALQIATGNMRSAATECHRELTGTPLAPPQMFGPIPDRSSCSPVTPGLDPPHHPVVRSPISGIRLVPSVELRSRGDSSAPMCQGFPDSVGRDGARERNLNSRHIALPGVHGSVWPRDDLLRAMTRSAAVPVDA